MKIALVLILAIASTLTVTAQDRNRGYVLGLADAPCLFWTSNKQIPPESSQLNLSRFLNTWLVGFVSGAKHANPKLGEIDFDEAISSMDRYCAEHSSTSLAVAAGAVVDEFAK